MGMNARERKRVHVLEMKCLMAVGGVRWFDGVRNVRVREKVGNRKILYEKVEQAKLKWFDHIKRMGVDRIVKRMY